VYYACGLGVLASVLVGFSNAREVTWWEASILLVMYVGYVIVIKYNRRLYKMLTGKELVPGSDDALDDEENNLPAALKNTNSMTESSRTVDDEII
jgi:Ca2+/Na+ antiporter